MPPKNELSGPSIIDVQFYLLLKRYLEKETIIKCARFHDQIMQKEKFLIGCPQMSFARMASENH